MALTLRTNGSSGVNLVTASWWNDYYNLLTGVMQDQIVTLKTDLILAALGTAPAAPTLALAAGTTLGVGVYKYLTTNVDNNGGETLAGTSASITTTTNNQAVSLSAIATGPTGTAKRNIYRTKVGLSVFLLLTTLNDNTTTTYTDTIADASLGSTSPPAHPSFGGSLLVKDGSGVVQFQVFSDGIAASNGNVLAQMEATGTATPGVHIFTGTTTPSGAVEGDIWINA